MRMAVLVECMCGASHVNVVGQEKMQLGRFVYVTAVHGEMLKAVQTEV